MKFIIFALLLNSFYPIGDKFIVTTKGVTTESGNNYTVITVDSLSAQQLYTKSYNYIQESMKNPRVSLKGKIVNEMLRYDIYVPDAFKLYFTKRSWIPLSLNYTIELKFQDGRVKYELLDIKIQGPSANPLLWKQVRYGAFHVNRSPYFLWNEDQELEYPELKTDIEKNFNNEVSLFNNYMIKDKENW